jgi:hypothetical protein
MSQSTRNDNPMRPSDATLRADDFESQSSTNATGTDTANLSENKAELINRKSINPQTTDVSASVYTPLIEPLKLVSN